MLPISCLPPRARKGGFPRILRREGTAAITRNNRSTSSAAAQGWCVIEPSYIENINVATFAAKLCGVCLSHPPLSRARRAFLPGAFALLCGDAKFARLFYFNIGDHSAWIVNGGWSSLAASPTP
jgi:hypothetical protein